MKRKKKHIPHFVYLALIAAVFVLVGRGIFGTSTSGWKTDFDNAAIDMSEVLSGGVPRDGIPPIDDPQFEAAALVRDLSPQSPVISIDINGDARAYPLEILTRHEIVNDVVGTVPVAVTFCPLCNSAIVYHRQVEGRVLRFGVSGNLRNSDLIMWDDYSESWWQQLTGEGIVGDYRGYQLELASSQVIGFGLFQQRYPAGRVLRGPYGGYGRNPYVGYDSNAKPFLFRGPVDHRLFPTERVLAAKVSGQAVAYSFGALQNRRLVNDRVNGSGVVVFWQAGAVSALDAADIDSSRDVGMALMFEGRRASGETLTFRYEDGAFFDNETESRWNFFGEATDGLLAGESLTQLNAFPHFWFAWAAFYPETALYKTQVRDGG